MTRAWSLCGVWEAAAGRLPTRGGFPWENSESSFPAMFDSMKQLPQFILNCLQIDARPFQTEAFCQWCVFLALLSELARFLVVSLFGELCMFSWQ